jgi:hypothetical protein
MAIKSPRISAYHPEIHVDKDGELQVLKFSVPDWAPEDEIVKEKARELQVETVGELVEAMRLQDGVEVASGGITKNAYIRGDRHLWDWNDRVI